MHPIRFGAVIWLASPAVLGATLLIMCRRRLHLAYPYFASYILLQVVSSSILFGLSERSYAAYYYTYYGNLFLSAALSMAIFWDIFRNAFDPHPRLRPLPVSILRYSIFFIVIAMTLIGFHLGQGESVQGTFGNWTLSAVSATRFVQCGLFLLLLLFHRYLGISHHSVMFGIALGFVLFALVSMVMVSEARQALDGRTLSLINSLAYCSTTLIWLIYVIRGSAEFDIWDECVHRYF
jgi:hypothetical protein